MSEAQAKALARHHRLRQSAGMRALDLPKLGVITNPIDGDVFGQWSELTGRDLLCIGLSEEQIDRFIAPHAPNSVQLLTNWADHVDSTSTKYPIAIGDVTTDTGFSDGQFDITLTLSLLEHVSDVRAALKEMARISRLETVHVFGPVWSSPYGHHLCTSHDHPEMNFYRWQMPAHIHLLCSREEVGDYYDAIGLGHEMGESVSDCFHNKDFINRAFFDEYLDWMHDFQVVRFESMFNRLPGDHLRMLREAFPGRRDFATYGSYVRLQT